MLGWFHKKKKQQEPEKRRAKKRSRLKVLFATAVLGLSGLAVASRGVEILRHTPPDGTVISDSMPVVELAPATQESGPKFPAYKDLPEKWRAVMERSGDPQDVPGSDVYAALSSAHKACLLNIFAKAQATALPDGSTVLDHMLNLREIRQDRIFLTVDDKLAPQLDASDKTDGAFYHRHGLDGIMHRARESFDKYGSYKTHDARGNLDITLSDHGRDWMAEMDIDYYKGFRHFFFEVAYNHILDTHTNPVKVEKILRQNQGIDPGYRPP